MGQQQQEHEVRERGLYFLQDIRKQIVQNGSNIQVIDVYLGNKPSNELVNEEVLSRLRQLGVTAELIQNDNYRWLLRSTAPFPDYLKNLDFDVKAMWDGLGNEIMRRVEAILEAEMSRPVPTISWTWTAGKMVIATSGQTITLTIADVDIEDHQQQYHRQRLQQE